MRTKTKGRVTISQKRRPVEGARGRLALRALRGTADTRMSTNEILTLTRDESLTRTTLKM